MLHSRDESYRRGKFQDTQTTKKYSYLNDQNYNPTTNQQPTKILETISEQAFTDQKGSLSNRSEINTDRQKISSHLSQRNINPNQNNNPLHQTQVPIKSARSSYNLPQNTQHQNRNSGFHKKSHHESIQADFKNSLLLTESHHRNTPVLTPLSYKPCQQCSYYSYKISQLQNSYELLLLAKNQQLEECKIIIFGLQEKLLAIQKRSQQQLEKNKKMRAQFERKNFEQTNMRQKENEMMQYLKNREIILMQQIKQLQNQMFISKIKSKQQILNEKFLSKKSSSESNPNNPNKYSGHLILSNFEENKLKNFQSQKSISQYSANTCKQQTTQKPLTHQRSASSKRQKKLNFDTQNKLKQSSFTEKVPLTQILLKNNQIQSLKDDLLVSQLKTKIQQTKNLHQIYKIR